jgi:hypothetical protein
MKLLPAPRRETSYSIRLKADEIVGMAADTTDPLFRDKKEFALVLINLLHDKLLTKLELLGPDFVFDDVDVVLKD